MALAMLAVGVLARRIAMAKKPGKYYINAAEKSDNVDVDWGKGDHALFRSRVPLPEGFRNPMPCPYNLKGNGLECAIVKRLKAAGVLLVVVLVFGGLAYLISIA